MSILDERGPPSQNNISPYAYVEVWQKVKRIIMNYNNVTDHLTRAHQEMRYPKVT